MTWLSAPIRSVAQVVTGNTPPKSDEANYGNDVPWVKPPELGSTEPIVATSEMLSAQGAERARVLPKDAVLVSCIGSIGRVGIAGVPLATNQQINAVVCGPGLLPRFAMYWFMHSADALSAAANSAVVPILNKGNFEKMPIPVWPLREQARIVELLDEADRLRRLRREADAKAARILPALFLKMFGDPATNPLGWPKEPIGQLGNIVTGKTPPTNNEGMFDGPIPFATPGDLDNWLCSTQRTVTEAGANYTKLVRAGSALVGCIGNVGKMAKTPVPTTFNQQINAIEWSDRIDDDFGISALSFEVPTMQALATSTTLPILNKSTFSSIKLIVPPISDQAKFSRLAVMVQQSLTQSQSSSSRLEKLFEVLLARAFSGQLTGTWRESRIHELLAEMAQQARALNLPLPKELEVLS